MPEKGQKLNSDGALIVGRAKWLIPSAVRTGRQRLQNAEEPHTR